MTDTDAFLLKQEKKNAPRIDQMRAAAPYVLMRVGETHDEAQLHAAVWNDSVKEKDKQLRPKDLHEMFAGLLALLDEGKFSKARGFDEDRSRLIANMLLYTIIGHGDPKTYLDPDNKAIEKAYVKTDSGTQEIDDTHLFELADSGALDFTSVSRSQYLKIVKYWVKSGKETDKYKVFDTPSGLHPVLHTFFEENGGLDKIQNDHAPMFEAISEDERMLLLEMRRMVLIVDSAEMVLPPLEAGLRKFIVKKSEERDIFAALNPLDDDFDPDDYVKQLITINGHNCKSDFENIYEEFLFLRMTNESGLLMS
jgi:hypothetical protein